jgi:hypothetical protein
MKKSILIITFILVIVFLQGCSGFQTQRDFDSALKKLRDLDSYSVTIKDEIISNGVVSGENVISNTNYYKGIVEFKDGDVTTYYYMSRDNTTYDLVKIQDLYIPNGTNKLETEKDGIIDFSKKYKTETENDIDYVYDILGVEKAEYRIDDEGILNELIVLGGNSVGSSQFRTTIIYNDFNDIDLDIRFIEPESLEYYSNSGFFMLGRSYNITDSTLILYSNNNYSETNVRYFHVTNKIAFYTDSYTYSYHLANKTGTLTDSITDGSKNMTMPEYLNLGRFTMINNQPLNQKTLDVIIEFINLLYDTDY